MDLTSEAIRQSGRTDIHIDPQSMPHLPGCKGDPNYFGLYVYGDRDCSDFWRTYYDLKNDPYWSAYITLSSNN